MIAALTVAVDQHTWRMTMTDNDSNGTDRICLDLFAGLGGRRDIEDGFGTAFQAASGWEVVTVDIQERFEPDVCADVMGLRPEDLPDADVILAAPPCTHFSMANQPNPHWDGDVPDSDDVREHIALTFHTIGLIHTISPDYWFLENPRQGKMDVILGRPAGHVTYCQYGLEWQKPTDLWGKHPSMEYRRCPPGSDCHQRSEGGWDTGEIRKNIRDPAERSLVPGGLSKSILEAVEREYSNPRPEQTTLTSSIGGGDGRSTNRPESGDGGV
jgi:hypothetical protein